MGDNFFKTSNLPPSPLMRIRKKTFNSRLWMMFYSIHCNQCSLQCFNGFILHRTWWFVWLWSAYYNNKRSSYGKLQYNVKDEIHLKTENASTDYCSLAYYASVCQWCQDLSEQTPFFEQFGEHQSMISQISKQETNQVSHKNLHRSEQDVAVTSNHNVTQHHSNKWEELISFCINGKMNEPVFENSMFTDDKSYEISIYTWVFIQNIKTGYKQLP